jgi:hypothetical protein
VAYLSSDCWAAFVAERESSIVAIEPWIAAITNFALAVDTQRADKSITLCAYVFSALFDVLGANEASDSRVRTTII